jgi:hypothetical protein
MIQSRRSSSLDTGADGGIVLVCVWLVFGTWASYFGSWLDIIPGFPAGGMIRDVLMGMVVISASYNLLRNPEAAFRLVPVLVGWALVALMLIIEILGDSNRIVAVLGARNLIVPVAGIATFIIVKSASKESRGAIANTLIISGLCAALLGLADVESNGRVPILLGYDESYSGSLTSLITEFRGLRRASAGLADSLNYGYFSALMATYALYVVIEHRVRGKLGVTVALATCMLSICTTILSLTRGAVIALFFSLLFVAFKKISREFWMFGILGGGALACALVGIGSEYRANIFGRFMENDQTTIDSSVGRLVMTKDAYNVLCLKPGGVGLGSQGAGDKFTPMDMRIDTDNYFIYILLEMGVFCGGLYLAILVFALMMPGGGMFGNARTRWLGIGITGGWAIAGMLSSAPVSPFYGLSFWVIVGYEAAGTSEPLAGAEDGVVTIRSAQGIRLKSPLYCAKR